MANKNRLIAIIISSYALLSLQSGVYARNSTNSVPEDFSPLYGTWEGYRWTKNRDGSTRQQKVKLIAEKLFEGNGMQDSWYFLEENGDVYWGTTVRAWQSENKKWQNVFYNNFANGQGLGKAFNIHRDGDYLIRQTPWRGENKFDRIKITQKSDIELQWRVDLTPDDGKTWVEGVVLMELKKKK